MLVEIDVLGLSVKTFGICFALGFLASGAIIATRLKELGKPVDWAYEMVFAALIGGIVGARLWYLAQHTDELSESPFSTLFGGSGLVWYGGLIGGAVCVIGWARWRGFRGWQVFDVAAVPLAVGHAIGRIGCQLSGDGDYGKPSDLPWAMPYPEGTVPTDVDVHPTPLYEALLMGTLGLVLWQLRDRVAPGRLFAIYLVVAGTQRFLIEYIRRNAPELDGLTLAQGFSVLIVGIGITLWVRTGARASAA